MQPLFRPEAVAHATQRLDGDVLLPAPLVTWGAVAFVAAVLALGAWFTATASYTRTESAEGWLALDGGVSRAVSRRDGNVLAVLVAEGDLVEAGAPIARVGTTAQFGSDRDLAFDPSASNEESVEGHGGHIVAAPVGGRVEAVAAREGEYVSQGSTVALVAASDELVAEILMPPQVAGLVTSGQGLRLKYEGRLFGYQGVQHGTVTHVSRRPVEPDDTEQAADPVAGPVYRVQVRLPAQEIDIGGVVLGLRAGMRVTAEIPASRRTLFQTLYETIR
ncbi:MAG: HlyD family efflux transporter periplasmic adaptor subunit [Gammaproteobacteria bacterium]|nr:HlyD family efflux transporter periplasmic adaptor subunit [Gammaproteobacteria bacterium]